MAVVLDGPATTVLLLPQSKEPPQAHREGMITMLIRRKFVCDTIIAEGYTDGTTWEGFQVPVFALGEAQRLCLMTNTPLPPPLYVTTEDGDMTLYPIGAYEWAWLEA